VESREEQKRVYTSI